MSIYNNWTRMTTNPLKVLFNAATWMAYQPECWNEAVLRATLVTLAEAAAAVAVARGPRRAVPTLAEVKLGQAFFFST